MSRMPKLYYCNTIYFCNCGKKLSFESDLNPLIFRANPKSKFLVICSRQSQVVRIEKLLNSEYKNFKILHYGWWDAKDMGLIDINNMLCLKELMSHDIVIILDKKRIDQNFIPLCSLIESLCKNIFPTNNLDPTPIPPLCA